MMCEIKKNAMKPKDSEDDVPKILSHENISQDAWFSIVLPKLLATFERAPLPATQNKNDPVKKKTKTKMLLRR